ncbi:MULTISPECIES: DUF2933 domain-containing protein [unclassified Phenylobacterium]|uniref:DUF2933 domain-containing protein n=1 Tax=unclassified Phenylobacterium TaxID=2640670 RepID=UPI0009E8454C|nr:MULTISPECIES: DUF2933 domain-containing protein [unclassified Phenylobacterium]
MEWLSQNWIWVVAGLAFVALHLFGHGGHGGHGRHRPRGGEPRRAEVRVDETAPPRDPGAADRDHSH